MAINTKESILSNLFDERPIMFMMCAVSKYSPQIPLESTFDAFNGPVCSLDEQQTVQKDELDRFIDAIYLPTPKPAKKFDGGVEQKATPELIEKASSSIPELSWQEQIQLFNFIPKDALTEYTAKIIEIGKITYFFDNLSPNDLSNPQILAKIQEYAARLEVLTPEILAVYSRNGTRAEYLISYLFDAALKGENTVVFRIDMNATEMNHVDAAGNLANEFLPYFAKEAHDRLTTPKAVAIAGRVPAVTHQPDRTSFVIAGPSNGKFIPFREFLYAQFDELNIAIGSDFQKLVEAGRIGTSVDVANFEPQGVVRIKTIPLRALIAEEAAKRGIVAENPAALLPRDVILDIIEGQLRILAAETTAIKAMPEMVAERAVGGLKFYGDTSFGMLPETSKASLETFLGKGYVPFYTFIPEDAAITPEQRARLELQDIPREIGKITGGTSNDGAGKLERFLAVVRELEGSSNQVTAEKLAALKKAAVELGEALIQKGAEGRRDARYPAMVNPDRNAGGASNDFFIEEIVKFERATGIKYDTLACIEVDNAKAFFTTYSVTDKNDSSFQTIRKIIFQTAKDMGLPPVIVEAKGDQITIAYSTRTLDGRTIPPEAFPAEVQSRVRYKYSNRKFQQYEKVVDQTGQVSRQPLWEDASVRVFGARLKLKAARAQGYRKHMTGLTVTCSYTEMPNLYTKEGRKNAHTKIGAMYKHIDGELKTQRGQYTKEGLGRLSEKFIEQTLLEEATLAKNSKGVPTFKIAGRMAVAGFNGAYEIGLTGAYGATSFLAAESLMEIMLPVPTTPEAAALFNADVIGTSIVLDRGAQIVARQIAWRGAAMIPELAPFGAAEFFSGFGWASQVGKVTHDVATRCGASPAAAKYIAIGGTGAALATAAKIGGKIAGGSLKKSIPLVGQAYAATEIADMGLHLVAGDTMTELDARYQKKVDENFKYSIFGDGEAPWYVTTGRTFGYLGNLVTPSFISKGVDWLFYY